MEELELWKDISGFEGVYQISNFGQLKSFKDIPEGRILSNKNKNGGYFSVVLCCKDGKKRYCRLHVLVAEAFVPNPDNKPEVNHIDHNKQNTPADNLEWTTIKENGSDSISHNPNILKGMKFYNQFVRPRIVQQLTECGTLIMEFPNGKAASEKTGVCHRNIIQVADRTEYKPGKVRKQAGGFVWRFRDAV